MGELMTDFLISRVENGWIVTASSVNEPSQSVFADSHSGDLIYDQAESLQRALYAAFGPYMAASGHAGLEVLLHKALGGLGDGPKKPLKKAPPKKSQNVVTIKRVRSGKSKTRRTYPRPVIVPMDTP